MAELSKLTIAEARDAMRKGDLTSTEVTEACIAAVDAADALNAFCAKTFDSACAQAKAADARIKAGDAPDMCGIPLGIKDLFCTKGVPAQAASNILAGFRPEYESTITQGLWDQGAVMLGKLNMDEFAMGSSNETSAYGPVASPWQRKGSNVKLTPGGSSGGSAAAVSGDLCLAATGTDTGLDPPARRLYRHCRVETDLRSVFALGHRCLCLQPRSGRADDPHGSRCRDHVAVDGGS